MSSSIKSRRDSNTEATRKDLIDVARDQFAKSGYAGVELTRIAKQARVTTGAIYHHFGSKKGLFQAVAEKVEGEILAAAGKATGANPWERLENAFDLLIDFCAATDVQRIIFIEAPQVIGPEAWRKIELRYAYGASRAALEEMLKAGILQPCPVDLLARTLLAILAEAAAEVSRAPGDAKIRSQIAEMMKAMLASLRVAP